jgi:iron complex outermembrane receptor protein
MILRPLPLSITTALLVLAASARAQSPIDADYPVPPETTDTLPDVVVTASPLRQSADDIITPVTVLSGAALDDAKAATIGETVAREIGVQTTAFGAGVGRPVIRGLDGPRVSVLSNGLGSGDVSTVSQDHAVAIEPFLADQIEVLKGPSTLLYGSGAIGGVVNVVDGRIPMALPANGFSGRAELRGNSVSDERTGMARVDAGAGAFAFHVDAAWRDADDYEIPGGTLANSFVETKNGAAGASWIGDRGFVGVAVSRFLDRYGNPAEPGDAEEEGVTLALAQTRYDLKAELRDPLPGFAALRISGGHVDYRHTEFEGDEVGTVFLNRGNEGRIELVQNETHGWLGAIGLQFIDRRFEAIGEEAFIPQTATRGLGVFALQQKTFGAFTLEAGARIDRQASDPIGAAEAEFTPLSLSLGGSYRLSEHWHLTANLDRAERAPAEEELFSNGPHVATNAFEIGDPELVKERANQVEIGLHFHSDRVEAKLAAYANRFDDYIYLVDTGEFEDELAVRQWSQADAKFHGFEGEAKFVLAENAAGRFDLRLWGDTVDARLREGGNLPRIAPARTGIDLGWTADAWRVRLGAAHYFRQDEVTAFETETPGFTLVNAHLSHTIGNGDGPDWEVFVDANNLTNATARLATSYIKDLAPLPGRSFAFGVRTFF